MRERWRSRRRETMGRRSRSSGEAAGLAPRDADIQNHLGEALERLGALDAAADAYQQALAVRPDFSEGYQPSHSVLVKAGRGPEAIDRARALVRIGAGPTPRRCSRLGLAQSETGCDRGESRPFGRVCWPWRAFNALAHYKLRRLALPARRSPARMRSRSSIASSAIEPRPQAYYQLGRYLPSSGRVLPRAPRGAPLARLIRPRCARCRRPTPRLGGRAHRTGRQGRGAGGPAACGRRIALRPDSLDGPLCP